MGIFSWYSNREKAATKKIYEIIPCSIKSFWQEEEKQHRRWVLMAVVWHWLRDWDIMYPAVGRLFAA